MIASPNHIYLTPEEYLEFEEESDIKHAVGEGKFVVNNRDCRVKPRSFYP